MYRHFALLILNIENPLFVCYVFSMFFSLRAPLRPFRRAFAAAVLLCIAVYSLLLPDSLLDIVALFTPFVILLPWILSYLGRLKDKLTIALVSYLFLLFIECLTVLVLTLGHLLLTGELKTYSMILAGTDVSAVWGYTMIYSFILLFSLRLLPVLKQYIDTLGMAFFLRLSGPFLLIFLAATSFFSVSLPGSFPLFLAASAVFFLLMALLIKYGAASFHFFIEREKENAELLHRKELLEQQLEHSRALTEKYRETRRVSHDISAHLTSLTCLMDSESWEEARAYIKEILDKEGLR